MKAIVLVVVISAASASAAEAPGEAVHSPAVSGILADLHAYYGGELRAVWILGGLGVLSAGSGAFLVTQGTDFTRGMGWTLLGLGALEIAGGISYVFQVYAEIDRFQQLLFSDAASFRALEMTHMEATQSRFVFYRLSELALALGGVGVAVYGFIAGKDVWKGIGIAAALVGTPFFVVDSFNNARAGWYLNRLRDFVPTVSVDSQGARRTLLLGMATRF